MTATSCVGCILVGVGHVGQLVFCANE